MTKVTWQGEEITNPIARAGAVLLVVSVWFLALPFHPLLRLFGLQGFVRKSEDGGLSVIVDRSSFASANK